MIAYGIVINWEDAKEYIRVDLNALSMRTEISETREWWPAERRFVRYNTSSQICHLSDGTFELTLCYERTQNQHIRAEGVNWGESTIGLNADSMTGSATWHDSADSNQNGTVQWTRVSTGLFKETKREHYSRLQRQQDVFRSALLTFEGYCVLSGEKTVSALEAAHIIPSKNGGAEVVENGMLLRADLHRLYDNGKFSIDPSGQVVEIKGVSEKYEELLRGAKLSTNTIERVYKALCHQWKVRVKQRAATQ